MRNREKPVLATRPAEIATDRPPVGRAAAAPWSTALALTVVAVLPALAQPGPKLVAVSPVLERDIPPSTRLVGSVLADRTATVASEVPGIVARFDVREGQQLKAGEVICALDPEPAELRLAQGKATLATLEARLLEWRNGPRTEEIARLTAGVAENKAMRDKWEFESKRIGRLFSTGQSSEKEKNEADMEFIAAERRLAQAAAALDEANNGTRPEVLLAAEQDVAAQRAQVSLLEREARRTQIRAPFDGFVVSRHTEVGAWIVAGGPVCDFIGIEKVRVRVDAPESAIAFARPGSPALVEVAAAAERGSASVTRVVPQAAAAARTFPIEIELPNADHKLLPGMFAVAYVASGPPGKRLLVSKDAIVSDGLSKRLWVVRTGPNDSKMALPLDTTTGLEVENLIEVQAAGLAAGDLVVSRANETLFFPTPVIPLPLDEFNAKAAEQHKGPPPARPAP